MVLSISEDIERKKPNLIIELKCAYCGKVIYKYWYDLPRTENDYCDASCMKKFRKKYGYSIDNGLKIDRQIGVVPNFCDIPPEECMKVGRLSCLNCKLSKCIFDKNKEKWQCLLR